MSDNEEHIPPTSDIRETYASAWTGCHNQLGQDYFDRWHAAEIRRAKAEAWDEGYDASLFDGAHPHIPRNGNENPYREVRAA